MLEVDFFELLVCFKSHQNVTEVITIVGDLGLWLMSLWFTKLLSLTQENQSPNTLMNEVKNTSKTKYCTSHQVSLSELRASEWVNTEFDCYNGFFISWFRQWCKREDGKWGEFPSKNVPFPIPFTFLYHTKGHLIGLQAYDIRCVWQVQILRDHLSWCELSLSSHYGHLLSFLLVWLGVEIAMEVTRASNFWEWMREKWCYSLANISKPPIHNVFEWWDWAWACCEEPHRQCRLQKHWLLQWWWLFVIELKQTQN